MAVRFNGSLREYFFRFMVIIILLQFFPLSCGDKKSPKNSEEVKLNIIVSVLPQKYFVERIGGPRVKVDTIVQPGQSPAVYELTQQQMVEISNADIYFRIGVPFENIWMKKIADSNKKMKIIDTRSGIKLREIETFYEVEDITLGKIHHEAEGDHNKKDIHNHTGKDPHIWLDPQLVIKQAETIAAGLIKGDPEGKEIYRVNLSRLKSDLRELDSYLSGVLSKIKNKNLVVFHPSWGYFTDRYGMNQIPIEIQGRNPGQKELSVIIDFMKTEKSKVIFIQKQFSTRSAATIASAVNGSVVRIDPLAENYIENMKMIGKTISEKQQ